MNLDELIKKIVALTKDFDEQIQSIDIHLTGGVYHNILAPQLMTPADGAPRSITIEFPENHPLNGFVQKEYEIWKSGNVDMGGKEFIQHVLDAPTRTIDTPKNIGWDLYNNPAPQSSFAVEDKMHHFIVLVPMGGKFIGRIGQHSTHQKCVEDAERWATERFNPQAVVVLADEVNSLDTYAALTLYLDGINKNA